MTDRPKSPPPVRQVNRPTLIAPPGSCDCHVHLIGPQKWYPNSPEAPIEIEDATYDDFRRVQAALGFSRALIVASGLQGFAYHHLLHSLSLEPSRYRGVAILPPDITDRELAILDGAGVVGARFYPGISPPDERMLGRIAELGWSAHFTLIDPSWLAAWGGAIDSFPGRFVIEHSGMPDPEQGIRSAHFQRILGYLDTDRCWVKLSHRFSRLERSPFTDSIAFNKSLVDQRPDRMLYGSDYPHPNYWTPMPNEAEILDLLLHWAPSERDRELILRRNPEDLFGFTDENSATPVVARP